MKTRLKAEMNGTQPVFYSESYYTNGGYVTVDSKDDISERSAQIKFGDRAVDLAVVNAVRDALFSTSLAWMGTPKKPAINKVASDDANRGYDTIRGTTWLTSRQYRKLAMKLWREFHHARLNEAKPAEEEKVLVKGYTRNGKAVKGYTRGKPTKKS